MATAIHNNAPQRSGAFCCQHHAHTGRVSYVKVLSTLACYWRATDITCRILAYFR